MEKGGEPAGTWAGNGVAELGFNDGETVRREDFEPLTAGSSTCAIPSGKGVPLSLRLLRNSWENGLCSNDLLAKSTASQLPGAEADPSVVSSPIACSW